MLLLRKYMVLLIGLLLLSSLFFLSRSTSNDAAMASVPEYSEDIQRSIAAEADLASTLGQSYLSYLSARKAEGIQDTTGYSEIISGEKYSSLSEVGAHIADDPDGSGKDVVVIEDEGGWVEYEVEIAEAGFYQMGLTYYSLDGKGSSIQRKVSIDGQYPFFQSERIAFSRMWKESKLPWFDNMGNEFNSAQEEVKGWQYKEFSDPEARVEEPFRYSFTKGTHKIRIHYLREPAAIGELHIFSPVVLPTYEKVLESYRQAGYTETNNFELKLQAENAALKSDPTLRRTSHREPATEPFDQDIMLLNTIGGSSWRDGGQWIEWEFEVPKSGLYEIGSRFLSQWLNQTPVQRTVYIDGIIPFKEMNAVNFPYAKQWQSGALGMGDTEFLVYLEEGEHKIRMEVQVGQLGQVFEVLQQVSQKVSYLSREIIMLTGTNPDKNREWELERNISNLIPRLHLMAIDMQKAIDFMQEMGTEGDSPELAPLATARDQLINLAAKPGTIPSRIGSLSDIQSAVGSWITSMSKQRLQLDYLVIKSPERPWPSATAGMLTKLNVETQDFFTSFVKDYTEIGSTSVNADGVLEVWVARGRDWVQIIKQLADEDFTAKTGIQVEINIIPSQAMNLLMLATTSGKEPDVALGVEAGIPVEFALRNGLKNLNQYPDYEEVAERFRPGALIPYKYQSGNYALPENQNFSMMFYRTDIMEELGMTEIPETWDDVMEIIPTLKRQGMDFYYPHTQASAANEFAPFLFQNGGEFYQNEGTASALDSPEALAAASLWTSLYTNFNISREANFYNRFRTGEIPIGVADYSTYVQLMTTAPELTGRWKMVPIPGMRTTDGSIDRSVGGASQTGIIFESTDHSEEAWEFLKWWTSAPVQQSFGTELEAIMGVEARWNTANVEALTNLPWPKQDIDAILEQWDWFKEREIVPGDYYTVRYINNIWSEVVLKGKNVREALEDGVKEINREIDKKREEFGLDSPVVVDMGNKGR